jgi:hypothetical protein
MERKLDETNVEVRKQIEEDASTILTIACDLAVAYERYRATTFEMSAEDRYSASYSDGLCDPAGYEDRAMEESRDFCQSAHMLAVTVLNDRHRTFSRLVILRADSDLLAMVGAVWGELIEVSQKLSAGTPASQFARVQLAFLPPSEQIERILSRTLALAALLKRAASDGGHHCYVEPEELGGAAVDGKGNRQIEARAKNGGAKALKRGREGSINGL